MLDINGTDNKNVTQANDSVEFTTDIEMQTDNKRIVLWESEINGIKFRVERVYGVVYIVVNNTERITLNDYLAYTEDVAIKLVEQHTMIVLSGVLKLPANDPTVGNTVFKLISNDQFRNLFRSFYTEKETVEISVSEEVQKLTPLEQAIVTVVNAILSDVRKLGSNGYIYHMRFFNDDFYVYNGKTWSVLSDEDVNRMIVTKAESLNIPKIHGSRIDAVRKTLSAKLPGKPELSDNYLIFDDCVINTQEFFLNGKLQCLQHSPELPAFYYISHTILSNKELVNDLRSHILTEDYLDRLAQKYTPETYRYFRELVNENWNVLYKIIGYGLVTYGNPLNKMIVLVGTGSNGKTTFTNFLRDKVYGEHNVSTLSLKILVDEESFDRYLLYHKLLNIDDDMPSKPLNVEELKRLTGSTITTPRKFKSPLTFPVTAKLIFNSNYYPSNWIGVDNALARRLWIIEFPNTFPENGSPKYPDGNEISACLLLSMYYAKLVLKTGILYQANAEKVQMLRTAVNQVQKFIEEMEKEGRLLRVEQNQWVEYRDLKLLYKLWVGRYPLIKPLNDRAFKEALEDLGFSVVNYHNPQTGFSGRIVRGLVILRG